MCLLARYEYTVISRPEGRQAETEIGASSFTRSLTLRMTKVSSLLPALPLSCSLIYGASIRNGVNNSVMFRMGAHRVARELKLSFLCPGIRLALIAANVASGLFGNRWLEPAS